MTERKDSLCFTWVITQHNQIWKVGSNGKVEEISPLNFALNISYGNDQTLWVVPDRKKSSTYEVLYSENEGMDWKQIRLKDIQITDVAATHMGSCFLLTAQGAIYLVQKSGELKMVFNEKTAHHLAVSPEGYIWIISRDQKPDGGNLVYWCTYGNFTLQPAYGKPVAKRIAAGPGGIARIITIGGEVASLYLNRMGGLETPGGKEFARSIAASSNSNTIWTICRGTSGKRKHNILRYWNPDLDSYMDWHTIRDIEPFIIAGGE